MFRIAMPFIQRLISDALTKLLLGAMLALTTTGAWAQAQGIVGTWKTIDDHTHRPKVLIQISTQANGMYSGTIIKILDHQPNASKTCSKCDGALKDQPILGMTILTGLHLEADGSYGGGRIVDPESGHVYSCKAHLEDDGAKLNVRGYIGLSIFGRTQTWLRDAAAP